MPLRAAPGFIKHPAALPARHKDCINKYNKMLITLLIGLIVFGIAYWIITLIPLPAPFPTIAMVILGLIALIWVLGLLGAGPGINL